VKGHPVFIAQHATAACCRGCIQEWHGIEKDSVLNEVKVDYVVALIMGWIWRKLNCAQIVPVKVKYFQMVPNETKSWLKNCYRINCLESQHL
jgi:hypothetical protein